MSLKAGDAAPSFSACNPADMKLITSSDFADKTVVLSFFPAAFSGSPSEGCEMQLCGVNSLVDSAGSSVAFYGVSGDLPFASAAFKEKLALSYPLLSDPTLRTCKPFVGECAFGAFLKEHGVSDALEGVVTTNRGCVVIKDGKVLYAFSGEGHPGKMPSLAEIKKAIAL